MDIANFLHRIDDVLKTPFLSHTLFLKNLDLKCYFPLSEQLLFSSFYSATSSLESISSKSSNRALQLRTTCQNFADGGGERTLLPHNIQLFQRLAHNKRR